MTDCMWMDKVNSSLEKCVKNFDWTSFKFSALKSQSFEELAKYSQNISCGQCDESSVYEYFKIICEGTEWEKEKKFIFLTWINFNQAHQFTCDLSCCFPYFQWNSFCKLLIHNDQPYPKSISCIPLVRALSVCSDAETAMDFSYFHFRDLINAWMHCKTPFKNLLNFKHYQLN